MSHQFILFATRRLYAGLRSGRFPTVRCGGGRSVRRLDPVRENIWYDPHPMPLLFGDVMPTPRCLKMITVLLAVGAGACGSEPPAESSRPVATPLTEADLPADSGLARIVGMAPAAAGMVVSIVLLEPHSEIDVPLPTQVPVMDQIGRQFVPGFILVRTGQIINFTNSEDELHTVHVKDSAGESLFNIATMMGTTYDYIFDLDGDYSVECNTHTEMFADIMVVDAPYAVVADRNGGFTISDVIPGAYTATVVSGVERIQYEIDITAGSNEINLTES